MSALLLTVARELSDILIPLTIAQMGLPEYSGSAQLGSPKADRTVRELLH